jgi:RNA polymerase sigma-19 factor, ECF subfamily
VESLEIGHVYEQYRSELRRFLARQSHRSQNPDDLVQEVYMQLLRFPPRETLREPQAYLYKIAWNVVNRSNLRAAREAPTVNPQSLERLHERLWTDDVSEQLDAEQRLAQALAELPRPAQAAILLFKRDGLSYREIASEMGISIHTVKKYIARAIVHFKNLGAR